MISLTPNAVDAALTKPVGGGSAVSPTAGNLAGDDATLIAGYQASADVGDLLRQFLPVLRAVLPAKFEAGMVLRAIDALVLFQDYTLDGASYIRVDGTQITLRGSTVALPDPGQPGGAAAGAGRRARGRAPGAPR